MQMPFFPFYLNLLNSPYGSESAQRKTRGDLMLGKRPHQNSSICGQLGLCVCVGGGGAHVSTCLQSTYVCASPHITAKIPIHWSLEEWLLSRLEWTRRDWWSNQCPKKRGGLIVGPGTYYSEVWDRWAFFIGCIMWLQLKHNIFVLLKLMLAKMNKKSSHSCFFSL